MKDLIIGVLTVLGSLGLFLYGMKMMSESLQLVAGNKMRSILSSMTSNKFAGVLTGVVVTSAIQSSSATTVMVVSFVNAGLLSLSQSIGVIMGANIGTTITAWIISILGLKIKLSLMSIPIIGITLPFIFSGKKRRKLIGEIIFGFAILFLGLGFLKDSLPDLNSHPELFEFLKSYTELKFWSVLIFIGIGTVLTIIIQSSSATMALTIIMCNNGWIPYEMAAAMVLGENIGTTITANIAALIGNASAKRTALAHTIFNLIGVIWMLLVFNKFLKGIDLIINPDQSKSAFLLAASIPITLSLFHTCFNLINTSMLIWFTNTIKYFVEKIIPNKTDEEEEFSLRYISIGMLSTGEMSILQAQKEIAYMGSRIYKMYKILPKMMEEKNPKCYNKQLKKIAKIEEISDRLEIEIAEYITKISEGEVSKVGSQEIRGMLKIIDELESIADVCYQISKQTDNKRDKKLTFNKEQTENLKILFEVVEESILEMIGNLNKDYRKVALKPAQEFENKINRLRDKLKKNHYKRINDKEYSYEAGIFYCDIISLYEKIGDHVINVTEAIVFSEEN